MENEGGGKSGEREAGEVSLRRGAGGEGRKGFEGDEERSWADASADWAEVLGGRLKGWRGETIGALRGVEVRWVGVGRLLSVGEARADTYGVVVGSTPFPAPFPAGSARGALLATDPPSFRRFAATALRVWRRTPDLLRSGEGGRGEMGRTGKRSSPAEEPSCSGRSEAGSVEK